MKLRKHTQWLRRSVDETGRIIVVPELREDPRAARDAVRHVQLFVPTTPELVVAVGPGPDFNFDPSDPDALRKYLDSVERAGGLIGVDDAGTTPEDIGSGRVYQWPEPPPGIRICFHLLADQWLSAMAVSGVAKVSVILEYQDG